MKYVLRPLVLLAVLAFAPMAFAAPATDQQVDQLMKVMRVEQTLTAVLPQIRESQQQMVAQLTADKSLSTEQRKRLDAFLDKSSAHIAEAMAWQKMQPIYREIYRQSFTGEDVDSMVAFYSSTAGQSLLDKMPQLMQNTMAAMQKILVPVLQGMQKDLEAEATQMQGAK